jgi:ribosomal protein L7Ae-like RNA K-turn-binding protein
MEDIKPTISNKPLATNSNHAFPLLSSSTSLPTTSSWGRRHNDSVSALLECASTLKPAGEKQKDEVEEFPSLSTASTISHIKQGYNNLLPPMAKAMKSTTDKQRSKSKTSLKKGAPQASLASFLSNQVVAAHSKKSKDARLPLSAPNKVGTKRSAPSSATNGGIENGSRGIQFLVGGTKTDMQRLRETSTPRKKKLTTLKKKVLKERLRVWKERNGIVDCDDFGNCAQGVGSDDEERGTQNKQPCSKRLKTDTNPPIETGLMEETKEMKSTTLLVENFVRPEDNLVDEDEYDEIISDLVQLAERIGKVVSVFIPRPQDCAGNEYTDNNVALVTQDHIGLAFVQFATDYDACAANEVLDGMVVGGQNIRTTILNSTNLAQLNTDSQSNVAVAPTDVNTRLWRLTVLRVANERQSSMNVRNDTPRNNTSNANTEASTATTIVFHKILCEDDYEDEEALHESIEDLKGLAADYGQVVATRWETGGKRKGNVYITYAQQNSADAALKQLNGLVVGGSKIVIGFDVDSPEGDHQSSAGEVILINILNDDDLEDEDCLSESLNDIRTLAEQYGIIGRVHAEVTGEKKGNVLVSYLEGDQIAQQAAQQLDGKVFGGRQLSASVSLKEMRITESLSLNEESKCEPLPIMLSGGKRIPEQFAACKRVPKVPNTGKPRAYASKIADERAVPLLIEMLGELMRLQERSKDDKNARARRRLVMGLREVARGIRAHKVKMVIMANNLDEYGAIDSKLQEILDMATADELPILFELNKRKLGKALGKSIKVSVVGIQNADGAHDQFKKLKKMLGMA